jgi:hypothetical protein
LFLCGWAIGEGSDDKGLGAIAAGEIS